MGVVVPLRQALALALAQPLAEPVPLCDWLPHALPLAVGEKLTVPQSLPLPEGV